jgi:hypothetical protein
MAYRQRGGQYRRNKTYLYTNGLFMSMLIYLLADTCYLFPSGNAQSHRVTLSAAIMFEPLAAYWPMLVVVVSVGVLVTAYFHHGLNRYPGPFLARFTDLWRVVDVSHDHHEQTMIALHRQYGSVVRIGPNTVSISSPDYIPRIYGINKGYVKVGRPGPAVMKKLTKLPRRPFTTP